MLVVHIKVDDQIKEIYNTFLTHFVVGVKN